MKTKTKTVYVGDLRAEASIYVEDGAEMDTTVQVPGGVLCCVSGTQLCEFIDELNEVINRYRI